MNFNKACDLGDFAEPELVEVLRDACAYKAVGLPGFPKGTEHRKDWEVAMAVRALQEFGALRPDSVALGVAAGIEDTVFYLTRRTRQVFATDRYLSAGEWGPAAPAAMLVDPATVAPVEFERNRLVVQHMDARSLTYPDNFFDGVFSSSSVEHVGGLEDVASAAYEMGRVLKPGGVLSLSTEIQLSGPPGGIGWPGQTLIFTPDTLRRYIVEASGLEPVDDLDLHVSEESRATWRDLAQVLRDRQAALEDSDDPRPDYARWEFPHVVLHHGDYEFTSVHLTLLKTGRYPVVPNRWAAPSAAILDSVREWDERLLRPAAVPMPAHGAHPPRSPSVATEREPVTAIDAVVARLGRSRSVGGKVARRLQRVREIEASIAEIDRQRAAVREHIELLKLRESAVRRAIERRAEEEGEAGTWLSALPVSRPNLATLSLTAPGGLAFTMVFDPQLGDPLAAGLAAGCQFDQTLVELMLTLVRPGEVVVDVGAHLGQITLPAAAAGCKVLAVEASPSNAALLRASAARNAFTDLHVVQAAASDRPGTAELVDDGPFGRVAGAATAERAVTVPAVTLDEVLDEMGWRSVSFVKLDVEGSEIRAIEGMRKLLSGGDAPPLLVESNGHTLRLLGATPNDLLAKLEELGYDAHLVDAGRLVRVRAHEFQPQTIVDYLAFKQRPRGIDTWTIEAALGLGERVSRVLADCRLPNADHRAYMAAALAAAGPDVLSQPQVSEVLDRLLADPAEAVREAARWWADRRAVEARKEEDRR